jgi:Domain of unknown function (DUF6894)
MPRFYFHFRCGATIFEDAEGAELPGRTAAREHAIEAARDVMRMRSARHGPDWSDWSVRVCDRRGNEVLAVSFAQAEGGRARLN